MKRRIVSGAAAIYAATLACNMVLGIDEAHVDRRLIEAEADASGTGGAPVEPAAGGQAPALPDASGAGGGAMALPDAGEFEDAAEASPTETLCDAYCREVMDRCTGEHQQYLDSLQCQRVCSLLTPGELGEDSGNTVACRLKYAGKARYAAGTELEAYCRQAGPGGDGACGSNCNSFCRLMTQVCTADVGIHHFASMGDCESTCQALPVSDVPYSTASSEVYDGNHVQCRLFHVTSAAMLDPEEHCEHAMGITLCEGDGTEMGEGNPNGASP